MKDSNPSPINDTTTARDPQACSAFMLWLMRQPKHSNMGLAAKATLKKMRQHPPSQAWQMEFQCYLEQVANNPSLARPRGRKARLH